MMTKIYIFFQLYKKKICFFFVVLFFYFPRVMFVICIPFTCMFGRFFFLLHVNCKYSYFVCVRIYFYADFFIVAVIVVIVLFCWFDCLSGWKSFDAKIQYEKWETITVNLHVIVYAEIHQRMRPITNVSNYYTCTSKAIVNCKFFLHFFFFRRFKTISLFLSISPHSVH